MQALLIIDMQRFVEDRIAHGIEYAPQGCTDNMERALNKFRQAGRPILHVRHEEPDFRSSLHKMSPLSCPMTAFDALDGEQIFIKNTSSAFASTTLSSWLTDVGITDIAVIGAVAGYCVNSTVRMGADLGFNMTVINDAIISFPVEKSGLTAQSILAVTLGLFEGEFARLISTDELH